MILTWRSWFFSASSHMTSVTKRNILDSMGEARGRSYTPHKHHPLGWIFFTRQKYEFFYFLRKQCLQKVLNLHRLPNEAYRCYNCVPNILPTPCTSLTYGSVSAGREKWPFNVLFFLKVEPPCDQTWWDSLVFSILSCFSYVVDAENTLVGPVGPF